MSDKIDLLSIVQPPSGWFCILGIKNNKVKQNLVETREEVDKLINEFVSAQHDVYFGVAKFKSNLNREKDNVDALKSLWIDIDCGESKAVVNEKTGRPEGYIDQATGLKALKKFCTVIGLPKPILVNSGRGIHAYWPFTSEVTREEWEPVASRLRDLCITHDFYVDTKVTADAARVLRIPNTFNFKDDPPKPVEVILGADPLEFNTVKEILGVKKTDHVLPKPEMSELGKAMMANLTSSFSKIMARSGRGTGCNQLLSSYTDRANLSEPRWFSALSIAKFCKDKEQAIHKLSEGHPDYDPAFTEQKIAHIKGPHSCVEFERANPGGCEGCKHKDKITSPIALGKEVLEADQEDNTVIVSAEDGEQNEVHVIPDYPSPYLRGKNGGIFVSAGDDEEPVNVYQNDIYVVKRMRDPLWGEVTLLKLHLPRDGVKEFTIPNSHITDPKELRKALSSQGVACNGRKFKLLGDFILACINELQIKKRAEQMRQQFGWADKNKKFILGDRELSAEGTYHSPPSSATKDLAPYLSPMGSIDKWKEVFQLYNKPGLEPHAFAALTAFGSPLLKFLGQTGAIINVIHSSSGTGKSTILRMCNSVWGHPTKIGLIWEDTFVSKILTLGMLNNLPFTVDEVTNMHPKEFSTLVYSMSQGRGRHRAKSNANELRTNNTTWQSISLCSSNSSFYQKLSAIKNRPDGEFMRLLEYRIEPSNVIPADVAKEMFDHQLSENYGHAGEIYAKHLLGNLEEVGEGVKSIQAKIDKELKLEAKERFWSAVIAANITGGLIANRIGLIDWDVKRIYLWATDMLQDLRKDTSPPATNIVSVIGDYINRHMQNVLVVNDEADLRTHMQVAPIEVPRGELLIRYEPDTKKMFLATKPFKDDCVDYQIDYKELLNQLKEKGIYQGSIVKRLGKGMKVATPGVNAIVLDCANSEFIQMDDFVRTENAGGESQLPN